jgi:hypothetical protein
MRAVCLILLGLGGVWGCNDKCTGTYECPIDGAFITLPSDISARVTSAKGDTCDPQIDTVGNPLRITSVTYKPCHVVVQLDDGTTRSSTVTFQSLDDCCNGHTATATPFEATDGGVRG